MKPERVKELRERFERTKDHFFFLTAEWPCECDPSVGVQCEMCGEEQMVREACEVVAALEAAQQRVAELGGIVNRLPKTSDGVPVVPGAELWVMSRFSGKAVSCGIAGLLPMHDYEQFYSTREAAEAAGEQKPPEEDLPKSNRGEMQ
jgi:hypothetical protein